MTDTVPLTVSDASRARLFQRLADLGIDAPTDPYPPHTTVEEGKLLRGQMAGLFTKNLLLKDKKGRLFLLSIHEDRVIDLKTLHRRLGARGQLGFASREQVELHLGVAPGALTPLGLLHDGEGAITVVLDRSLLDADQVNFHPLVNSESIGRRPADLVAFVRSCAREPVVLDFDQPAEE